jgi:RNA polymerase sigma-70 factor (ECF subfamily)
MLALSATNALPERAFVVFATGEERPVTRSLDADPVESAAIERARGGDGDAFDLLVARWSRRVASLAWTLTGSADAAEEIAQETFVRAWRNIGRFRAAAAFGPWILRIATNLSVDHLRRARRFEPMLTASDAAAVMASPERQAIMSETAIRIGAAIDSLPGMQRIVAQLFLVEEYDHAEIAEMTGLTQGTVRSHLSIARAKLRQALGEESAP